MIPLGIRQSGMGDILCPDLAGAPGKQRTPTSRAWNWPHCGLAMGMLVVLRATGWVLQETQSLKRRERDTWNLPLLALPADVLSEDWRKPVECAPRQDGACERSGSVIPGFCAGPCSGQMDSEQPRLPGKLPEQALQDSRPRAVSSPGRKTAS